MTSRARSGSCRLKSDQVNLLRLGQLVALDRPEAVEQAARRPAAVVGAGHDAAVVDFDPRPVRPALGDKNQRIEHGLSIAQVQHDGITVPCAVAVLLRPVDRIDRHDQLALASKPRQVAGRFLGFDAARSQHGVGVPQRGDDQLLNRQIGERQRVCIRTARVFAGKGDVVPAQALRQRSAPAQYTGHVSCECRCDFRNIHRTFSSTTSKRSMLTTSNVPIRQRLPRPRRRCR